jgi:hypothetical protein
MSTTALIIGTIKALLSILISVAILVWSRGFIYREWGVVIPFTLYQMLLVTLPFLTLHFSSRKFFKELKEDHERRTKK